MRYGFIAIFVSMTLAASAQEFVPSVGIGYSTYSMKSMRNFQEEFAKGFPVNAEVLQDFPAYINYWGSLTMQYDDVSMAIVVGHTSTGGRIYYQDYSGYIGVDNLVSMTYAGLTPGFVLPAGKYKICPGANVFAYFNKLDVKSFVQVGDNYDEDHSRFKSLTLTLGPYLDIRRQVGKFMFAANLSANFPVFADKLYFEGTKAQYLVDNKDKPVTIGGAQLRAGLSVGLILGQSRGDLFYHRVTRID